MHLWSLSWNCQSAVLLIHHKEIRLLFVPYIPKKQTYGTIKGYMVDSEFYFKKFHQLPTPEGTN